MYSEPRNIFLKRVFDFEDLDMFYEVIIANEKRQTTQISAKRDEIEADEVSLSWI